MTLEEKKVADDLELEILDKDKQQECLTKEVRDKNIYDFLKNDSPPRQRMHNCLMDGMKYVIS